MADLADVRLVLPGLVRGRSRFALLGSVELGLRDVHDLPVVREELEAGPDLVGEAERDRVPVEDHVEVVVRAGDGRRPALWRDLGTGSALHLHLRWVGDAGRGELVGLGDVGGGGVRAAPASFHPGRRLLGCREPLARRLHLARGFLDPLPDDLVLLALLQRERHDTRADPDVEHRAALALPDRHVVGLGPELRLAALPGPDDEQASAGADARGAASGPDPRLAAAAGSRARGPGARALRVACLETPAETVPHALELLLGPLGRRVLLRLGCRGRPAGLAALALVARSLDRRRVRGPARVIAEDHEVTRPESTIGRRQARERDRCQVAVGRLKDLPGRAGRRLGHDDDALVGDLEFRGRRVVLVLGRRHVVRLDLGQQALAVEAVDRVEAEDRRGHDRPFEARPV